jgi:hypothetical protein
MKKTAVEWLQAEIDNKDIGEIPMWAYEFIEQAKAMEKEQIVMAYHNGYSDAIQSEPKQYEPEQYYTETYGK